MRTYIKAWLYSGICKRCRNETHFTPAAVLDITAYLKASARSSASLLAASSAASPSLASCKLAARSRASLAPSSTAASAAASAPSSLVALSAQLLTSSCSCFLAASDASSNDQASVSLREYGVGWGVIQKFFVWVSRLQVSALRGTAFCGDYSCIRKEAGSHTCVLHLHIFG